MSIQDNYIRSKIVGTEGVPNYVTVTAINNAGIKSYSVSDPVVLDTSLPTVEMVCTFHTLSLYYYFID